MAYIMNIGWNNVSLEQYVVSAEHRSPQVNLGRANCVLAWYGDDGVVPTFSSFRSSDLSQSI